MLDKGSESELRPCAISRPLSAQMAPEAAGEGTPQLTFCFDNKKGHQL